MYLRFGAEIAIEDIFDGVHVLRPATERQHGRIGLCRIVILWEDHLVVNGHASRRHRLLKHFRAERQDQEHRNDRESQQHPFRFLSVHRGLLVSTFRDVRRDSCLP
jgi:hypothetical protein